MAKKKVMNLEPKGMEGSKLFVVDVSALMRSNYVPLSEPESGENSFKSNPYAKFQKRELSWMVDGEKKNTSALYGLLRVFNMYGFDSDFVFCFDTPKNFRKQEFSEYKAGREKADDEYFEQVNVARDMLSNIGFVVHSVEGYEADDFVVEVVNKNKKYYDHVYVVTNDFDLAQLVDDNVYIKNVIKKRGDINKENYEEMVECPYNSILLYKAMVGDKSDNVKGIYRFGKAKFYKFLEEEGLYNNTENIRRENKEYNIIMNSFTLDDTQKASALDSLKMVLPRSPKVPNSEIEGNTRKPINEDMFIYFLEKYGMNSILKKYKVFIGK